MLHLKALTKPLQLLSFVMLILGTLGIGCATTPEKTPDAWDRALASANLTKEDIQFDLLDMAQFGGADLQIPYHKPLHHDPLRIPSHSRIFRDSSLEAASNLSDALIRSLGKLGIASRRTLVGDPLKDIEAASTEPEALFKVIQDIHKASGRPLSSRQAKRLRHELSPLSKEIKEISAYLLAAEMHALKWRKKGLNNFSKSQIKELFTKSTALPDFAGEDDLQGASPALLRASKEIDLKYLVVGGIDLAHAVDKAIQKLSDLSTAESASLNWSTPLGKIMIDQTDQNNTYKGDEPYLLILDNAGDDVYFGGGATFSATHPVSVIIDQNGNDQYLGHNSLKEASVEQAEERKTQKVPPTFGAGVLGYGFLADLSGNDLYRSLRQSQGRADFGVGVLWDKSGNDQYDCHTQCQGSARFGAGLLVDLGGQDKYQAFQRAQGFGGIFGSGLLIDKGNGNDQYLANNTQIDFPALVDKNHNTSFVQGAACGLRADFIDAHSFSAGFGALVDEAGNNTFSAGFFAQGISYWYGVGILSVGSGNDQYSAGKYAQGASTHYGVGVLHEFGGNDRYKVEQELGQGEGHDFAVGFLIEEGGDDQYQAPNLALGCGSANGMGFFWDRQGRDKYIAPKKDSMGCTLWRISKGPTIRRRSMTLGLFIDTEGPNAFEGMDAQKKDKLQSGQWVDRKDDSDLDATRLIGIGWSE